VSAGAFEQRLYDLAIESLLPGVEVVRVMRSVADSLDAVIWEKHGTANAEPGAEPGAPEVKQK